MRFPLSLHLLFSFRPRPSVLLLASMTLTLAGCREQGGDVAKPKEAASRSEPAPASHDEHAAPRGISNAGSATRHAVVLQDEAAERGLDWTWPTQRRPMRASEAQGCGCALFDYDNDGWQDALLIADPYPRLFRNLGEGRFADVTEATGWNALQGDWVGCAVGDYDSDGWLDVLVTGIHALALLKNDGGNGFRDMTTAAGLDAGNHGHWGTSAGLMDLDGDQHLDLVILNYIVWGEGIKEFCELVEGVVSSCPPHEYEPERGEIWRNTGTGRFELVPPEQAMQDTGGFGLVLACTDLDDDGRIDLYLGNDGIAADLLKNQGEMRFDNLAHFSGLAMRGSQAMSAMGADFGDFDGDGHLDLAVTNFDELCFAVYRNQGKGMFQEASVSTGVAEPTRNRLGWGAKWLDLDNDGWLDLSFVNGHVYETVGEMGKGAEYRQPIQLFRNLEGKRFVDVVPDLPAPVGRKLVGRGSAVGDIDNDGQLDLLVVDYEGPVMLLVNHTPPNQHWLTLDLRGSAPNRWAHGAKVTASAGDRRWIAEVVPPSSFASSSDPRIHFGLGDIDRLDQVTIRWPDGTVQSWEQVEVDRFWHVEQAAATGK